MPPRSCRSTSAHPTPSPGCTMSLDPSDVPDPVMVAETWDTPVPSGRPPV
ncbi:hypothetical protein BQ8420_28950 [Nocardiopsis sp. JB363]|nr:hypothetical protein BQ8420_28950 [Nocardiopsis sp. JB363]